MVGGHLGGPPSVQQPFQYGSRRSGYPVQDVSQGAVSATSIHTCLIYAGLIALPLHKLWDWHCKNCLP